MALNKDILGAALNTAAGLYNDASVDPDDAAAVAAYRLNFWKAIAEQIIIHFKAAAVISVNVNTTGSSSAQSGTGTGTISA